MSLNLARAGSAGWRQVPVHPCRGNRRWRLAILRQQKSL